jgi:geranylgeranyl diphosphate synthase, type I
MTSSRSTSTAGIDVLAEARSLTEPAMRAAMSTWHPQVARVVAYHMGWVNADGTPATADGGKALRPALALLSTRIAGAEARLGLAGAVAVELVHNFSLLHDDVMDRDTLRRGRPTAWTVFGVGPAVLAGDALLTTAIDTVTANPTATRLLLHAVDALITGQQRDLSFETRTDVSMAEYEEMAAAKTGALFACAASIGAVYAGAPPFVVDALDRFGRHLGLAFQAVDDLLGIWGSPDVTAKSNRSDLRRSKKTLPVLAALDSGHPAAAGLATLLARDDLTEADLDTATRLIGEAGGRSTTQRVAQQHLADAMAALDTVAPEQSVRAQAATLATMLVERSR